MKKIEAWESIDGEVHLNASDARAYELALHALKAFSWRDGEPTRALARWIVYNFDQVKEIIEDEQQ